MKKILLVTAMSGLLFAPFIPAQQSTIPPATKSAQIAPTPAEFEKFREQMAEQMKIMRAEMQKIQQTDDPQARQKLLQEHWTTMRNAMGMMNGMMGMGPMMMGQGAPGSTVMGPGMMGTGQMMGPSMMGGPMMWGDYRNLTPEQLKQRQYMMGQYMGMQQMMMDHMMWHQYWMTPQAQSTPAAK